MPTFSDDDLVFFVKEARNKNDTDRWGGVWRFFIDDLQQVKESSESGVITAAWFQMQVRPKLSANSPLRTPPASIGMLASEVPKDVEHSSLSTPQVGHSHFTPHPSSTRLHKRKKRRTSKSSLDDPGLLPIPDSPTLVQTRSTTKLQTATPAPPIQPANPDPGYTYTRAVSLADAGSNFEPLSLPRQDLLIWVEKISSTMDLSDAYGSAANATMGLVAEIFQAYPDVNELGSITAVGDKWGYVEYKRPTSDSDSELIETHPFEFGPLFELGTTQSKGTLSAIGNRLREFNLGLWEQKVGSNKSAIDTNEGSGVIGVTDEAGAS